MTPATTSEQDRNIARFAGWKFVDNDPESHPYWLAPEGDHRHGYKLDANIRTVPSYSDNIAAVMDVERLLDDDTHEIFTTTLQRIAGDRYVSATPAQRAEAINVALEHYSEISQPEQSGPRRLNILT